MKSIIHFKSFSMSAFQGLSMLQLCVFQIFFKLVLFFVEKIVLLQSDSLIYYIKKEQLDVRANLIILINLLSLKGLSPRPHLFINKRYRMFSAIALQYHVLSILKQYCRQQWTRFISAVFNHLWTAIVAQDPPPSFALFLL